MARIDMRSPASPALRRQWRDLMAASLVKLAARILEDAVDPEVMEVVDERVDDWWGMRLVPTGRKTLSVSFWEKEARR